MGGPRSHNMTLDVWSASPEKGMSAWCNGGEGTQGVRPRWLSTRKKTQ